MIDRRRSRHLTQALFLALILAVSAGCSATFRGNELSPLTAFPPPPGGSNATKPSVYLDVSWRTKLRSVILPSQERPAQLGSFVNNAVEVVKESNLFSEVSTIKSGAVNMEYKIELDMLNHGNYDLAYWAGVLNGLSLGLIPVCATDNYALTAAISDRNRLLKRYEYNDHVVSWFHLIMAPVSLFREDPTDDVIRNMLRHLLNDIAHDQVVAAPQYQRSSAGGWPGDATYR